jgi:MscS family membrane protein
VAVTVLAAIVYLAAAWAAYLICAGIGERIAASSRIDRASIDASLIRVAARVVGIAAAITIIFVGASEVGLPIYGVIAGLGVGGLALGLAARPTLENLIGGFILYADRPVRVGDFCRFGDKYGTIEEIGLRSTRIRALDRTLVTIPNAEFSNMQLINVTRRDGTLLDTVIRLRQDTSATQMRAIIEAIVALLHADPDVDHETARVRFHEIGDYALGIGVRAHMKPTHHTAFLEAQERILFGIIRIIEDQGAALALPAHRTYHMSERPQAAPAGGGATAEDFGETPPPEPAAETTLSQADDA